MILKGLEVLYFKLALLPKSFELWIPKYELDVKKGSTIHANSVVKNDRLVGE